MSKINLSKNFIRGICKSALNEDLYPSGDISSNLLKNNVKKKVKLISNQSGIIGGLEFAKQTFKLIDKKIRINLKKKEGSKIKKGDLIATIEGNIKHILTGERIALNFLSHISGIATTTDRFVKKVGKKSKICCTRKTIPNLRVIQKYAVKLGGGINHRFNLSDEYLIKDNHVASADIKKLITHLTNYWEDIDKWWLDEKTQLNINQFNNRLNKSGDINSIRNLANILGNQGKKNEK